MRSWDATLELDRARASPLPRQLARGIAGRIRSGALAPGAVLPSSRRLARNLGVHRNTVLAAYAELAAEGWIESAPARGTFVSRELPARPAASAPARARFSLPPAPPRPSPGALARPPGTLELLGGLPDPRLVPAAAMARAYRRALRRREVLGYGDPQGHPRLRAALASMLGPCRGLAARPESILITRGAQMSIWLVANALLRPGDAVAVEALGYPPAWEAMRLAGARLVPVPVDGEGIRLDRLAAGVDREAIRAVYLTPHHQYPTTVTLSARRRLALLDLARRAGLLVVEDDYDHEFHYQGSPVLPLAAADASGCVVYVGTLSKTLAPGLRLGFVLAPAGALERLVLYRYYLDRQGDLAVEAAVAELFEDGEVQRHLGRARRAYLARRDALAEALRRELGGLVEFALPAGGMAIWCRVAASVEAEAWAGRALGRGVAVQPGRACAFDGRPRQALRLGFARHDERELGEAVRRLAAALPRRVHEPRPSGHARGARAAAAASDGGLRAWYGRQVPLGGMAGLLGRSKGALGD